MTACDHYPKTFPGLGGRVLVAVFLLLAAWGLHASFVLPFQFNPPGFIHPVAGTIYEQSV